MRRIPEPELMESEVQAQAYAQADFAEPHQRFIEILQSSLATLPQEGIALDLGCGAADISIRFAEAHPGWQVEAWDGSAAMLRYGHQALEQKKLQHQVTLRQVYLPSPDYSSEIPQLNYPLIFSNSLLHHLADPAVLWTEIKKQAAPQGFVFVMDLLRPEDQVQAAALTDRYASEEPSILQRDFFNSLLAAYQIDEVQAQLQAAQLSDLAAQIISDRHFIVWGQLR
ncbi:MAG: class I SAM-dependent methyltransferase [Acaryochloridaceae cyanobacterium SU_2_1]|nr:class I SAM-dependent methyltransferase [Acaryochloridaceae cyanobacterium SU_2_1]